MAEMVNPSAGRYTSQCYGDRVVVYNGERFFYCGRWRGEYIADYTGAISRNGGNGHDGDVRMRPIEMGPGEFTFTGPGLAPAGDVTWG